MVSQTTISDFTISPAKPLSVNQAFLGKKIKSKAYRDYEEHLIAVLPDLIIPEGPLELRMVVY